MKKLFFNLEVIDGYPPVSMESIWAEVTEEGYLKINNIPLKLQYEIEHSVNP